jgi:hypothetical protein
VALRFDLKVKQGADYQRSFPILDATNQPQTAVGWTVAGQIRDGLAPTAVLLHTLDVTISGTNVILRVPATTSRAWTFRLGRYSVELTDSNGAVVDFLEGAVVVYPETTR